MRRVEPCRVVASDDCRLEVSGVSSVKARQHTEILRLMTSSACSPTVLNQRSNALVMLVARRWKWNESGTRFDTVDIGQSCILGTVYIRCGDKGGWATSGTLP